MLKSFLKGFIPTVFFALINVFVFGHGVSNEILEFENETIANLDDDNLEVNAYIEGEMIHFTIINRGENTNVTYFVIQQDNMMLVNGEIPIGDRKKHTIAVDGATANVYILTVEDQTTGQIIEVHLTR